MIPTKVYMVKKRGGQLVAVSLPVKRESDHAIVLAYRMEFPDGSVHLILPKDEHLPDTPEKAMRAFCKALNARVQKLELEVQDARRDAMLVDGLLLAGETLTVLEEEASRSDALGY